jgi:hypothetical protein
VTLVETTSRGVIHLSQEGSAPLPDDDRKFNMSPEEAIAEMDAQLAKMRAEKDRNQLSDMTPDDAYEAGYASALFDYRHLTGPDPRDQDTNKENS